MGMYASILKSEARRLVRDEGGVALMLTLGVFLFLFLACCTVYAIGETISRRVDLQNACDAGAHAAAVAQADALSRMAVVNRAMSWTYVQTTKMQMDYITYNWLKVTCDNFAEDKQKCLRHDSPWDILHPSRNSGWTFIPNLLKDIPGGELFMSKTFSPLWVDSGTRIWPTYFYRHRSWVVINCDTGVHRNGNNRISNYIGMRDGNASGRSEEIKINGWDLDKMCLHFRQSSSRQGAPYGGDLDYVVGGEVLQQAILAATEEAYGGYGCPDLCDMIDRMKGQIGTFNIYLSGLAGSLTNDIKQAATEAIRQSLPRKDGTYDGIVEEGLEDYYFLVFGGVSPEPREYAVGDDALTGGAEGSRTYRSFFSGLRNTERDEMLFLNMADGLPPGARVTLADYFVDEENRAQGRLDVPGLDQWFVRCYEDEAKYDGTGALPLFGSECGGNVCIRRDWGSRGGIQRCYKNANYHDLRTQVLPRDIHRGNYCFDGVENFAEQVSKTIGDAVGAFFGTIPVIGEFVGGIVSDIIGDAAGQVVSGIAAGLLGDSVVQASCVNDRSSFPDTCSAIEASQGLVAEYEWASAYWLCAYIMQGRALSAGRWGPSLGGSGHVSKCFHIPIPAGALFGGATDNGYNPGRFLGWLNDVRKNLTGNGHSRSAYRTECMFIDGEPWFGCQGHTGVPPNGRGSNAFIKSYVRVYGDDRAAFDRNYYGAPAMPWLLNKDFFNGGGTIVVGLARRNRNAFSSIMGVIEEKTNIFSLFTPWEGSHLVAFSAGRAAYAPRIGTGDADGPDSVNAGGGTRYDIHYDAASENLVPRLPSGGLFDSRWREQKAKLESSPNYFGCVCTEDGNTASPEKMARNRERFRRQWNLCQTDWDGVLLPLRYARGAISAWEGRTGVATAGDTPPRWGESHDAAVELSEILMRVDETNPDDPMLWHRMDGKGVSTLKNLLRQGDSTGSLAVDGEEAFMKMIRARRIL